MGNLYIEYSYQCFDFEEVNAVKEIYQQYGIVVKMCELQPRYMCAALDELVSDVLVFISSAELQTSLSIFSFAEAISKSITWIKNKFKGKKKVKITSDTVTEKEHNIIVQVDNVKITFNKEALSEEELAAYLSVALTESKKISQAQIKKPIIIDETDGKIEVNLLEEYVNKKFRKSYTPIRTISHRKHSLNNRRK